MEKTICFYARLPDESLFNKIDFYSNDIKIFRELGYKVITASNPRQIIKADLYFVWWFSSGIIPLLIGKFLYNKPVVMVGNTHLNDPSQQGFHYRPYFIKKFFQFSLRYSDCQIATSKIEFEDLKNYFEAKNPILLYHAIDENKYIYSTEKKENIILTVSRLLKLNVERKKISEIIIAFKQFLYYYPDYKLYIVGRKEDDGYKFVKDKIENLKLSEKIVLTGSLDDNEKIKLFQKSRIYVQPTDYEGFGMAIAESMLCGTPVITSFNGAVKEVVSKFALHTNPNDPTEICNQMIRLIQNEKLYKSLRENGHSHIKENFSIKIRKQKISKIISEQLGNYET